MPRIYLDYAATTPLAKEVFSVMLPYLRNKFGNPSSLHFVGQEARKALVAARASVAEVLGCQPDEIIFTGGGTESDNLAIKGIAETHNFKGHIITSAIEHHAVLETCHYLEKRGVRVTFLKPNREGLITPAQVEKAIRKDTFLVLIMYANNEIGTIEPIDQIGKIIRNKEKGKRKICFHTDAVQAAGSLNLDVNKLHVDLLSLSGHKFYGPKGVGVLYVRRGVKLASRILGGGQERGRRSGTENISGIVGLASALTLAESNRQREATRLSKSRDWLIDEIEKSIPQAILTGHRRARLPGLVSFCFPGIEGQLLVLRLNERGYQCSSGSACTTGNFQPSHVLLSCGLSREEALGSLRISLGKETRRRDLDKLVAVLKEEIGKLRGV